MNTKTQESLQALRTALDKVDGQLGGEIQKALTVFECQCEREIADLGDKLRTKGAVVRMTELRMFDDPTGRAILERAYAADPRRTEMELLLIGARGAASELGAWWLAEEYRRRKAAAASEERGTAGAVETAQI